MKTLVLLLSSILLLSCERPAFAADAPLSVAVFNFQTAGEKLANKGAEAALLLGAQLSTAPDLMLVERQELEKVLGEQELGLSGTVSAETAAKVGGITGAKVLITGRIFEAGAKHYLVVKIIGTETSRVFGEAATFNDPATLDKVVAELGPKVAALIKTQSGALVAKAEDPAARIARLKGAVAGRKLPSVMISFKEQHLSRPVIDPAVETEIKRTLQEIGFEIIDPKDSAKSADVAVSGEAFSEAAGRRGNLVSCRSRVELQAARRADGKVLLTDREIGFAVDLAENIAAKGALENASRKLVDRLVPKLADQ